MKDIPGFEGRYAVTRDGRVWSHPKGTSSKNGRFLKQLIGGSGYHEVRLHKKDRPVRRMVHRLVALAYLQNKNGYPEVNHKNGIKTDNRAENLEWCTASGNMAHARRMGLIRKGQDKRLAKLNDEDVRKIRYLRLVEEKTLKEIATLFGVTAVLVCNVANGKRWKHVN